MPYLQVDLDAKRRWGQIATATGVHVAFITQGHLDLWEHCWREKVTTVSGLMLAGFFGPALETIRPHLIEHGFIRTREDMTWEVAGAAKRLGVFEAQSKAGKRAVKLGNLLHGRQKSPGGAGGGAGGGVGTPLQVRPSSYSQQPTASSQKKKSAGEDPAPADAATAPVSKKHTPSLQERFAGWFDKRRIEALGLGAVADHRLAPSRLNKELAWVKDLDGHVTADAAELFLADPYRRTQDPPLSLLWFSKDRAAYISKAQRQTS